MDPALRAYLAAWSLACLGAAAVAVRQGRRLRLFTPGYGALLAVPWKLATFGIAAAGMIAVAPWTGDPTWDAWDAGFMALLTYLTAPWSLGTLALALGKPGRAHAAEVFLAGCLWMFSTSWSYDLYILLRDGAYPLTWKANIALSSVLYASAGLLWNLEVRPGRGVTFAFLEPGWPAPPADTRFGPLAWIAAPFMVLAAALILVFVISTLRG
jgi:hypothetical protein